jgi:hypothetical protein
MVLSTCAQGGLRTWRNLNPKMEEEEEELKRGESMV